MVLRGKVGGTYKEPTRLHGKIGGTYRRLTVGWAKVLGVWKVVWNEAVTVAVSASTTGIVLSSLFTPEAWADEYVVKTAEILPGVEIGSTNTAYALAVTVEANGQAGSFAGSLTLINRGTISGVGGAKNSGVGGHAIWANQLGRAGQKLEIINSGVIRAGGGGGGRGGVGGDGSHVVLVREPASGDQYNGSTYIWFHGEGSESDGTRYYYTTVQYGSDLPRRELGANATSVGHNGWTYYRGGHKTSSYYGIFRQQNQTQGTTGGPPGDGGRGQGFDGAAASGANGTAGGPNAGAGGKGGDGGGWGAAGAAGASGGNGNVSDGAAGGGAGLAGAYINGASRVNLTNTGTLLGRSL